MIELQAPLSEEDVRSLKLGDVVYISGQVITGRDEMHIRALEYLEEGKEVPKAIEGSVLYHCGPLMKEGDKGWTVVSAGPTTSARMNSLESKMIRSFGIRAIIGKGGMSKEVGRTMSEQGCVYLAATGGAAVSLAEAIHQVIGVEWDDLGMAEALWKFDAERLGPLIVAMDARGNSLYDDVRSSLIRDA
jgi:hydro-lyases, Fe-S type, tartrate/fumarate subfamily, beta region